MTESPREPLQVWVAWLARTKGQAPPARRDQVVYAAWVLVLVAMYPLSKWYRGYKKAHPERWLLRYV